MINLSAIQGNLSNNAAVNGAPNVPQTTREYSEYICCNKIDKRMALVNGRIFLKLAGLSLLWGPAFMFMDVAIEEIQPLTLAAARVSLAAVILGVLLTRGGHPLPGIRTHWKQFAVSGLTYNALPFFLISWGQQYVGSALAAILVAATPLFTVILARLFQTGEHFSREKLAGLFLGFGGVILLLVPGLLGGVRLTLWGMAAILAGAASYGVAFIYTRQKMRGLPPLMAPTAQLAFAAAYLVPLALLVERPYVRPVPSVTAVAALFMLVALSTVLAFILYYRLMEETGSTTLSLVTYLNPIVATILGVVLLHEPLGWHVYLGCGLVLLGAARVNGNTFSLKPLLRLSAGRHSRETTITS